MQTWSRTWQHACLTVNLAWLTFGLSALAAMPFDAAPFALPLAEGNGLMWEDPREIHRVVVHFKTPPPAPDKLRLEYWGSWWPGRHLPKDREPGGADIGWMELGNWWKYNWRVADAEARAEGNAVTFTFRPVNAKEFPDVKNYPAAFRYTLKVRVVSDEPLPAIEKLEAFTDSTLEPRAVRLAWAKAPGRDLKVEVFNGRLDALEKAGPLGHRLRLQAVVNSDPNTFDRTLVTVRRGLDVFTFKVDDLDAGPLFLPHLGVAVLLDSDPRDYPAVAADIKARGAKTLYDRVAALPEQTWRGAWEGIPRKKSDIYFPLGLDGGRQRFRLNPDGSLEWRTNDRYLEARPGKDTPRLGLEKPTVLVRFALPARPVHRTLQEETLPICITTWETNGVRLRQVAFVTELDGSTARAEALTAALVGGPPSPPSGDTRLDLTPSPPSGDMRLDLTPSPPSGERAGVRGKSASLSPRGREARGEGARALLSAPLSPTGGEGRGEGVNPAPPGDAFAVCLLQFSLTNTTAQPQPVTLPVVYRAGGQRTPLQVDADGFLWAGDLCRGQAIVPKQFLPPAGSRQPIDLKWTLAPGESRVIVLKIPYLILTEAAERVALAKLDFDTERKAVAAYWRTRLNESATLITPEPMLNEFYRSHAMHLLVNCEREPGSDRRFARVGSFGYGAFGNESCMMVVDLDRRGYFKEAQDCLEAWLHYQGTVALPGSFESKDGVLYGAGGYEAGGYNQHHGWILWMLAEHYRFTRDRAWLERAAPGIVKGADWIIRETARTADRHELERGLLPAGSLEDIGDWWTWLSTSCYTWRGLANAAWALEQLRHPDAKRLRRAATAYHRALTNNFFKAMQRSPVVRLRDGTAVPKVPSHVHRRGRSFGWICETLEGALHLVITRAIDPHSDLATWIIKDYEDNLYLSNQYGYTVDDFERHWFSRGGMSMQACLLLDVEPYLYRDEPKHALRALFNAQAVSYFPDVRMNTEHAAPYFDDWRGDHFKSSDEANCAGWLRYLFVREQDDQTLLIGQAVPREWLQPGKYCGIEKTATWFGPVSVLYTGGTNEILCQLKGPTRNPPRQIRLRFRHPHEKPLARVTVNAQPWKRFSGEWVTLPGDIGVAAITARYAAP